MAPQVQRRIRSVTAFARVESIGPPASGRVEVIAPADVFIPTEFLPRIADSWHCYLRPFHRLVLQGNPEVGFVHYVLLSPAKDLGIVVLGSWVLTDRPGGSGGSGRWIRPRRLIHFPGFGQGSTEHPDTGEKVDFWHHITFEESLSGNLSSHPSVEADESGGKPRIFPTAPLKFKNVLGRHLGTAVIRQPGDLDAAGIAEMESGLLPHLPAPLLAERINDALFAQHAIVELAKGTEWGPGSYLRVDYALIRGRLGDREYPVRWMFGESPVARIFEEYRSPPKQYPENLTKVPLTDKLSLLVATSVLPGKPRHGALWVSPRSD